jgi:hypothetical protein
MRSNRGDQLRAFGSFIPLLLVPVPVPDAARELTLSRSSAAVPMLVVRPVGAAADDDV